MHWHRNTNCFGIPVLGAAEPRPGRTGSSAPGAGAAAALCARVGHTELESLPFGFWRRVKAVLAAEQWLLSGTFQGISERWSGIPDAFWYL